MIGTLSIATAKPTFEAFLFAPIGEQRNGVMLSVLSGLSRLDVDPWDDAERLALLPENRAIDALSNRIAQLPLGMWQASDTRAIAARLVALLPKHGSPVTASLKVPALGDGKSPASLVLWMVAGMLAASMLYSLLS
jgi:hypothetical protein